MSFISSVIFQTDALKALPIHLPELENYSQFVFFSHPRLKELYGSSILSSLKQFNRPVVELSIPEGEESKSLAQVKRCWQQMQACAVDRQAAVIALGGGVICDLAGFVASCYMRGLDTFYLPTTLVAMIDAALGGKTGINLPHAKNFIGTFYPPKQILIDPSCLKTLWQREFNSGLAEMIKYGFIADPLLVEKLEKKLENIQNRESILLEEIMKRCVALKSEIIAQDEKDLLGKRAVLNYGHTFGHAIEAVTHYRRYLHGEAVAIGMSCAVHLSHRLGLCDRSLVEQQDHLCQRANLPIHLPRIEIKHFITRMRSDKKAICGKINLILLERIGKVIKVCDVDPMLIEHVLLAKMS